MKKLAYIVAVFVLGAYSASALTYYVPGDYNTIQAAIDSSTDGDVVVIEQGVYTGSGNRGIKFRGKAITVQSSDPENPAVVEATVVDCENLSNGFVFGMAEGPESVLKGITVKNGYRMFGGGIYIYNSSSPVISNCVVKNSQAAFGGAITCDGYRTEPLIKNCKLISNTALVGGGAVYNIGAWPVFENCVITGNKSAKGGAFYSHNNGSTTLVNCTVAGNVGVDAAGGVYCYRGNNLYAYNSIFWGNKAPYSAEILIGDNLVDTTAELAYCDVEDPDNKIAAYDSGILIWGEGNFSNDPKFVDQPQTDDTTLTFSTQVSSVETETGDLHLTDYSPCIDAGNNLYLSEQTVTDADGNTRVSGPAVDVGAYEFAAPVEATVRITPRTLNLESKGKWVNCAIQLPEGYTVDQIDCESVKLLGSVLAQECDISDDYTKLVVKFSRTQVQTILDGPERFAEVIVNGVLNDGTMFSGTDVIRLVNNKSIHKGNNAKGRYKNKRGK